MLTSEAPQPTTGEAPGRADRWRNEYRRPRQAWEVPWADVGVGVALAGGAFPAMLAVGWLVLAAPYGLATGSLNPSNVDQAVRLAAGVLGFLVVGGIGALMITGFAAAVTLPIVAIAAHALGVRLRLTIISALAAGVVTFVVCSVVWVPAATDGDFFEYWPGWLALGLFPVLATPFGQFAGGYVVMANHHTLPWWSRADRRPPAQQPPAVRFSMKQILCLMALASVTLAGLQLAGLLHPGVLGVIVLWSVYQFATLWVVVRMIDRRYERLLGRWLAEDTRRRTRSERRP